MAMREALRSGRKAFLRSDWNRAKRFFLEVLEGASTEEEKRIAQRYLKEVYLQEGRSAKVPKKGATFRML